MSHENSWQEIGNALTSFVRWYIDAGERLSQWYSEHELEIKLGILKRRKDSPACP